MITRIEIAWRPGCDMHAVIDSLLVWQRVITESAIARGGGAPRVTIELDGHDMRQQLGAVKVGGQ